MYDRDTTRNVSESDHKITSKGRLSQRSREFNFINII